MSNFHFQKKEGEKKYLNICVTLFNYVGMTSILQEPTEGPSSLTASRCPQMASEEDARNMTFGAVQTWAEVWSR